MAPKSQRTTDKPKKETKETNTPKSFSSPISHSPVIKILVARVGDAGENVVVQYNTEGGPRRSLVPRQHIAVEYGSNALYVEEPILQATQGNDKSVDWLSSLNKLIEKPEEITQRIDLEMRHRNLFYWEDLLAPNGLNMLNSAIKAALQLHVSKLSMLAHQHVGSSQ